MLKVKNYVVVIFGYLLGLIRYRGEVRDESVSIKIEQLEFSGVYY